MKKSYERRLNQSFFVIESEIKNYKDNFEIKMLENNKIEGLLPLEIEEQDGHTAFRYDITSLKSLSGMLELKKLNEDNLRQLITEFHKLIYVLPEFLLDEEKVMIDSDYIFVSPKNGSLFFCYTYEAKRSSREQLRELLSNILSFINHDDHNAVVLGYQLFKVSQSEEFAYSDLLDVLNHFIPESKAETNERHKVGHDEKLAKVSSELSSHPLAKENIVETFESKQTLMSLNGEEEGSKQKTFRLKDLFGFKQRKVEKEHEQEEIVQASEEEKQWIEYLSEYDEVKEEEVEHTTLLSERVKELEVKELHVLKSLNRSIKDIELSFFPFVIGKQERVCDYIINANSISRIHLKINCIDGKYFVRDLNSLNGTKLRGDYLQTDKEEQIFENDELDIAGFKFVFV